MAAAKFVNTNMAQQRRLLDYGIRTLILFYHEPIGVTVGHLRALGQLHASPQLDIEPELYDQWLAALLRTAERNDPEFNSDLASAWTQVVRHGIAAMQSVREG